MAQFSGKLTRLMLPICLTNREAKETITDESLLNPTALKIVLEKLLAYPIFSLYLAFQEKVASLFNSSE